MDAPSKDLSHPQGPRENLRIFFSGFAMGTADLVPGVSGGTMAFILGIYETLINAIKSFNLDVARLLLRGQWREALAAIPLRFLSALGLGMVTAILALVRFLTWMLEEHPDYLFAFFFGLVVASIIAIGVQVARWDVWTIGGFIVGTLFALLIVTQNPVGDDNHSYPVLFFSGMIAIMAMILPGISGSFILLILGQYHYVLSAVRELQLDVIFMVGMGCAIGITIFARVLSWLLRTYEMVTLAVLTGFMMGSLWKIYPWRAASNANLGEAADHAEEFTVPVVPTDVASTEEIFFALFLMVVGFIVVTALDHMQSRKNPVVVAVWRVLGRRLQPGEASSASD
ncbi:MAG: DUF368 domain-containing protein [Anaerolineales bacterium]